MEIILNVILPIGDQLKGLYKMNHPEDALQISCIKWFDLQYWHITKLLHHSPNGGFRNVREAARFKKMGVRSGFPDFILLIPRHGYGSLCIELKVGKNTQTENQQEFELMAISHGIKYVICRSFDEFKNEIEMYLK